MSAARAVGEALALWRNPPFRRFCRSRLRLHKAIFWYLLTLIGTTFMVTITYLARTNSFTPPQEAARDLWLPLLIVQGAILMIKGTGSVAAGLIQDKVDQTLDYQRLTPMTPFGSLVGYLYGLPVLEYVLFALTLPHLVFVVTVGRIPLLTVAAVYVAFFTCVTLYHITAIAAGMVMRRWVVGYMLAILLVWIVNVILPLLSQVGLKFFQYLSVWPVIGQKVFPLTFSGLGFPPAGSGNPFFSRASDVPFFDWTLSPLAFTLLLQGALIATFGVMALRRWQSAAKHSLSKPYALGFLVAFIVVLIGNVWPIVTGKQMPFPLFGERDIEQLREVIPVGLPLVYALVTWLLCFVLFAIVLPTRHSYVRGIRRALKHGRTAARPWEDDAAGLGVIALFTAVALAGYAVLFRELAAAGFLEALPRAEGFWRLPLALGLVVFYTALCVQVLELRPTVLALLLVWLLPILVAIVLGVWLQDVGRFQAVVASLSPLALLLMSASVPAAGAAPGAAMEASLLLTGANCGLAFIVLQIALLAVSWQRRKRADYAACRAIAVETAWATPLAATAALAGSPPGNAPG